MKWFGFSFNSIIQEIKVVQRQHGQYISSLGMPSCANIKS